MRKKATIAVAQVEYPAMPAAANRGSAEFDAGAAVAYSQACAESAGALFEEAGKKGADLVLGPEDMTRAALYLEPGEPDVFAQLAQPIPGPLTERLAQITRRYRMYVAACFVEREGRRLYNTLVVTGRDGDVAYRYRKVHLPCTEVKRVSAGEEISVVDLDFAAVAGCICYDIIFPEHVLAAALKGADLILHPTVGFGWTEGLGEATLRVRANDCSVCIAAALPYGGLLSPGRSQVVDYDGIVLADAGYRAGVVVSAEMDFARERVGKFADLVGFPELRARLAMERKPQAYGVISAPQPPILSRYPGKRIL